MHLRFFINNASNKIVLMNPREGLCLCGPPTDPWQMFHMKNAANFLNGKTRVETRGQIWLYCPLGVIWMSYINIDCT